MTRKAVVKAGRKDSVASIARRYRHNPDLVADWNDMKATASLRPGQPVTLFLPVRAANAKSSARPVSATAGARTRATAAPTKRTVRKQR